MRPVSKNAHQAQLPLMPSLRMISVKRFALSVDVEAAITETPMSHHGMERPDRKNSFVLEAPFRDVHAGIARRMAKNMAMMIQSMVVMAGILYILSFVLYLAWRHSTTPNPAKATRFRRARRRPSG